MRWMKEIQSEKHNLRNKKRRREREHEWRRRIVSNKLANRSARKMLQFIGMAWQRRGKSSASSLFFESNNNSCFSSKKFISFHWLSLERVVSLCSRSLVHLWAKEREGESERASVFLYVYVYFHQWVSLIRSVRRFISIDASMFLSSFSPPSTFLPLRSTLFQLLWQFGLTGTGTVAH